MGIQLRVGGGMHGVWHTHASVAAGQPHTHRPQLPGHQQHQALHPQRQGPLHAMEVQNSKGQRAAFSQPAAAWRNDAPPPLGRWREEHHLIIGWLTSTRPSLKLHPGSQCSPTMLSQTPSGRHPSCSPITSQSSIPARS